VMFSGIIEETGVVEKLNCFRNLSVMSVRAKKIGKNVNPGDSIAVEGVCLTVTDNRKNLLVFDVMKETIIKSTLGRVKISDELNLERALKFGDRLNGHFMTGHIDDVGRIKVVVKAKNYTELRIHLKKKLKKYFVPKGSVCIDGVSLTVGDVKSDYFSVYLIPFTKKKTTLGKKKKGDFVNIETDILAKYLYKT